MTDANVRSGQMTDVTTGVNWYLNPYTKLVFNWVHAFVDDPALGMNNTDLFGLRAQVDF